MRRKLFGSTGSPFAGKQKGGLGMEKERIHTASQSRKTTSTQYTYLKKITLDGSKCLI
jgi:hypothetical protein